MNTYQDKIRDYLTACKQDGRESIVEELYIGYLSNQGMDKGEVAAEYSRLDRALSGLALKEYDRVWDVASALSDASERRGFCAGLRTGVRLMQELGEEEINP